jgi:hypothetical protein
MALASLTNHVLAEHSALIPKSGQIITYRPGDDGDLKPGVAWPNPRFTAVTNGTEQTVIDNLTELEWIKEPELIGFKDWFEAIDFCNALVYAGYSDWRLPNIRELESLVSCGTYDPSLPVDHPFVGEFRGSFWTGVIFVPYGRFWSSTASSKHGGAGRWLLNIQTGTSLFEGNAYRSVWPVRSRQ